MGNCVLDSRHLFFNYIFGTFDFMLECVYKWNLKYGDQKFIFISVVTSTWLICVCVCLCELQVGIRCLLGHFIFLGQGLSVNPEPINWLDCGATEFPALEKQLYGLHSVFYVGARDSNSAPHAQVLGTSPVSYLCHSLNWFWRQFVPWAFQLLASSSR